MVRFIADDFSVLLSILSILGVFLFDVIYTLTTFKVSSQGADNFEEDNPPPDSNAEDAKDNTEITGDESHHRGAFDEIPLSNGTSLPPTRGRATSSDLSPLMIAY